VAELARAEEEAQRLHDAGLILTPEQNRLRRTGADRRALQGRPWVPASEYDDDDTA